MIKLRQLSNMAFRRYSMVWFGGFIIRQRDLGFCWFGPDPIVNNIRENRKGEYIRSKRTRIFWMEWSRGLVFGSNKPYRSKDCSWHKKTRINWSGLAEITQNRFSVCSSHAFADIYAHTLFQGKVKNTSLPCFREVWILTIKLSLLHERTHTGDKAFKCTKCDSSFSSLNDLKNYQRTPTAEKLWVHKV